MPAKHCVVVDVGNTACTIGVYQAGRWRHTARVPMDAFPHALKQAARKVFGHDRPLGLLSSVVPGQNPWIIKQFQSKLGIHPSVLLQDFCPPMKFPSTAGSDRVANAYALKKRYGGSAVSVDFGTAIKLDVLSKGGDFVGGVILPGVRTGLEILGTGTALLPKLEPKLTGKAIGCDTRAALLSGISFGIPGMVDHLIGCFEREIGYRLKTVATGGDGRFLARRSGKIACYRSVLTLEGVRHAYIDDPGR